MPNTSKKLTVSVTGGPHLNLGDLRWFLGQVRNLDDSATVRVAFTRGDPHDQREHDMLQLTAEVPASDG
jgi:hypothetical protein